jgi:putative ABC transport system ATP-binding protein
MTTRRPLLKACGIERRDPNGGASLLRDVCLEVSAGDRTAVVGPSGAGKTLLLRSLALLDTLDAGSVEWNAEPVRGRAVPLFRKSVTYLHQRPAFVEGTVEDNLRLPFSLRVYRGTAFDKWGAVSLLEQLGREEAFLGKQTRDLSGGEGQLLALVRTIQLSPNVLLLDEPTASLDPKTTLAAEALIESWALERPGERAFLWVSHDQEQARRVARRELRIEAGRIVPQTEEAMR